jgi:hypothetical protein
LGKSPFLSANSKFVNRESNEFRLFWGVGVAAAKTIASRASMAGCSGNLDFVVRQKRGLAA